MLNVIFRILIFPLSATTIASAYPEMTAKQKRISSHHAPAHTKTLVSSCLDLMGGSDMLSRVHIIKTIERRSNFHLYDSEHSEPPYIPDYSDAETWIDLSGPAMRIDQRVGAATGDKRILNQVVRDGFTSTPVPGTSRR